MPIPLTSPQRKHLRRLAHASHASVHFGKHGLTPTFLKSLYDALLHHELIKLRFLDQKDEKKEIAAQIEAATGAALVSLVGHTALLYRQHPEPEKRKINLPRPAKG
jgi:RNA-binding protein